jgi:hypothetical protein
MSHDHEIIRLLHEILRRLPGTYTVNISQENSMSTTPIIVAGAAGSFTATLESNGSPYTTPSGSTYTPSYTWSASDTSVTITPGTPNSTASVAVPASDSATSFTLGASTVAPDGTTASGTLVVTIGPSSTATVFTVSITENAAVPVSSSAKKFQGD